MPSQIIVGVDEVGRGSLSGPVYVAAVVLPEVNASLQHADWIAELKDSKKLSAKKREKLAGFIKEHCLWSVVSVSPEFIDDFNILQATLHGMRSAVEVVAEYARPSLVVVDGNHEIPNLPYNQVALVNGDSLSKPVSAASILAKVERDQYMHEMHNQYPMYGWNKNVGYGTEEHRRAIMEYGVSPLHRKTFRGVHEYT